MNFEPSSTPQTYGVGTVKMYKSVMPSESGLTMQRQFGSLLLNSAANLCTLRVAWFFGAPLGPGAAAAPS